MSRIEEKPVLGFQRSEDFYQIDPQYHQFRHPGYAEPCAGYPSAQQPLQYYECNYPVRPLPYVSPEVSQGFSFGRVLLCLVIFLVLFALVMSMCTVMLFMTIKPTFNLESFVIRTFDISGNGGPGTTVKANLDTKVSVKNTNHRSSIVMKHAETMLVYRYVVLDTTSLDQSVDIERESTAQIMYTFSFPNQSFNGESVVREMAKDRQRGQIMFDLKLEVHIIIKSNVISKNEKMRLFCERITLNFQNNSSNIPTWDGSKSECVSGF